MLRPIRLRCFPREDTAFEAAALRALASVDRRRRSVDEIAAGVQARLEGKYPSVRVIPQASLATVGDERVLYAFRDGRITATS